MCWIVIQLIWAHTTAMYSGSSHPHIWSHGIWAKVLRAHTWCFSVLLCPPVGPIKPKSSGSGFTQAQYWQSRAPITGYVIFSLHCWYSCGPETTVGFKLFSSSSLNRSQGDGRSWDFVELPQPALHDVLPRFIRVIISHFCLCFP